ncbi:hypothetical protein MLD38_028013 [Melastoma candidum]|uniref:Uncharacterized protein n=1 Tax=Melastoma candidum TaxID=119954 RepID=A0ACB9N1C0_9MYRT|nr:hypothetical protein MLD38_028013 [Melastoma candidum]
MATSSASFVVSVLVLPVLAFFPLSSSAASWCVCKGGLGDAVLQKTLDYACGAGADCGPVKQTGACYSPNTVRSHCSYAVNSYFQRKGQAQGSCDFSGTAAISTSDPSYSGCAFPSSASPAAATTTPSVTTPSTTTPSTTTPSTTTPVTGTPITATPTTPTTTTATNSPFNATPTGILGTGVSPTGINTDMSQGGVRLSGGRMLSFGLSFFLSAVLYGLM